MARPDQVQDEELRELFVDAQGSMRTGQANDAVKTVVKALHRLLELKPELTTEELEPRPGWKMPFLTRWPQLGANFVEGSLAKHEPEIEFVKDNFALSEAITYYEFTIETAIKRGV
ncbi:MAG: hypothetical protein OXG25_10965 [Gammaproteobacteria bacterium]|nr:hypothetical protein [Gammaproteobacteria bacterium]MCY4093910.1 hypothetical protein [Gammaproteobacteria bacterium]